MDQIELKTLRPFIIDDTSHLRAPEVGDQYTSWFEDIKIIEVSEQMEYNGKKDFGLRVMVVKVNSGPGEGSVLGGVYELLYGDLLCNDDYTLIE